MVVIQCEGKIFSILGGVKIGIPKHVGSSGDCDYEIVVAKNWVFGNANFNVF